MAGYDEAVRDGSGVRRRRAGPRAGAGHRLGRLHRGPRAGSSTATGPLLRGGRRPSSAQPPTWSPCPVGVGSLAEAVVRHYRRPASLAPDRALGGARHCRLRARQPAQRPTRSPSRPRPRSWPGSTAAPSQPRPGRCCATGSTPPSRQRRRGPARRRRPRRARRLLRPQRRRHPGRRPSRLAASDAVTSTAATPSWSCSAPKGTP